MLRAKLKAAELKAGQEEAEKEALQHKLEQMNASQDNIQDMFTKVQDIFCPECGKECQQEDKFCGDCGHHMDNWLRIQ